MERKKGPLPVSSGDTTVIAQTQKNAPVVGRQQVQPAATLSSPSVLEGQAVNGSFADVNATGPEALCITSWAFVSPSQIQGEDAWFDSLGMSLTPCHANTLAMATTFDIFDLVTPPSGHTQGDIAGYDDRSTSALEQLTPLGVSERQPFDSPN